MHQRLAVAFVLRGKDKLWRCWQVVVIIRTIGSCPFEFYRFMLLLPKVIDKTQRYL